MGNHKGMGSGTRNTLDMAQKYKLVRWYETQTVRGKDQDMAAQAEKELGFSVVPQNVVMARETLGIRLKKRSAPKTDVALISALARRVERLEKLLEARSGT